MGKKHNHVRYLRQMLTRINFHEQGFFKVLKDLFLQIKSAF